MKRALLSVTDKTGVVDLGRELVALDFELVSTGGTAKALREAGLPVTDVSAVTGFPEMLDGRVKTLHPMVHGGLLGDVRKPDHVQAMNSAGMVPIELVVVNLYAFETTVSGEHSLADAIEAIDIGGPSMIRAAAKNWANVSVLVDPSDYAGYLAAVQDGSEPQMRLKRAAKAFQHTAFYDANIARYLSRVANVNPYDSETLTLGYRRRQGFRYGENPHQNGALFSDPLAHSFHETGIGQFRQLLGQELSYNNVNDADAAWELVADLPPGSCAIIKHGNPCGAASAGDGAQSYRAARAGDPVSAFGGIAAFNAEVNDEVAAAMIEKGNFLEVVLAPRFTEAAVQAFRDRSGWGQTVRLLEVPLPLAKASLTIKSVRGGAIVQESDEDPGHDWRVVTDRQPTEKEMDGLRFIWRVTQHVKSNAIVIGTATEVRGVGAGQMNRVRSVRLATEQAGEGAQGAVLGSDAFFPFPDGVEAAAAAGVSAIVQPGGSKKDGAVIECANRLGLAMIFTGVRHFRH